MASKEHAIVEITPEVLLKAYACGIFPMAESADDPALYWIEPEARGIIPLEGFHVPSRLARTVRSDRFTVIADRDFDAVIDGCAEPKPGRTSTWINGRIRRLYRGLFDIGHCHTIEVYDGNVLAGGLYGVSLGSTFFGESMFHRVRDASKVALVHLFARLRAGGFRLLDAQFLTEHLASLGAVGISREAFRRRLAAALKTKAGFGAWPASAPMRGVEALAYAGSSGTEVAITD